MPRTTGRGEPRGGTGRRVPRRAARRCRTAGQAAAGSAGRRRHPTASGSGSCGAGTPRGGRSSPSRTHRTPGPAGRHAVSLRLHTRPASAETPRAPAAPSRNPPSSLARIVTCPGACGNMTGGLGHAIVKAILDYWAGRLILKCMLNQPAALDQVFHALSDPARRAMVERLTRSPASVSELARPLAMSLPAVMQHLQVLEACQLVRSEKVGRVRTCHVEPGSLRAAEDWISRQRTAWEDRLDRLGGLPGRAARPVARAT